MFSAQGKLRVGVMIEVGRLPGGFAVALLAMVQSAEFAAHATAIAMIILVTATALLVEPVPDKMSAIL